MLHGFPSLARFDRALRHATLLVALLALAPALAAGVELKEGDRVIAEAAVNQLWSRFADDSAVDPGQYEALRQAVVDLLWHHQQDSRMVNGWYVNGGRNSPFGVVNFPAEYKKIRHMTAVRDEQVWALAQGKPAPEIDDSIPERVASRVRL